MADTFLPPLRVGRVTLTVHDLAAVSGFYQQTIGLEPLSGDGTVAVLGTDGVSLLELRRDSAARRGGRREAGLFHTAFLLPGRADLGRWVRHVTEIGTRLQGAADHEVSEAFYLSDPEGNGIEVYADRPPDAWIRHGNQVQMSNGPIDVPDLVASGSGAPWRGAPARTTVGHVHLQVGDLARAEAFYRDGLGLELTWRFEKAGFYGSGGYHHHIAANTWNSEGAPIRDSPVTGLAEVELLTPDHAVLDRMRSLPSATDAENGVLVNDPWNIRLRVALG